MGKRARRKRKYKKTQRRQEGETQFVGEDPSVLSKNDFRRLKDSYNYGEKILIQLELDDFLKDDFEIEIESILEND